MSSGRDDQTTLTVDPDSLARGGDQIFVVRWVSPLPALPPTWLTASRTTFGRDASSDVHLESGYVSRQHAVITRSGPLYIASDFSSKNGLAINGRSVKEGALSPGDVLRLGNFVGVCLMAPSGTDLSCSLLLGDIHGGFRYRAAVTALRTLSPSDLSVVIQGETGTGKERFARALHEASGRSGPFRAVNCAVYSKSMAAAELFGYRRGAFTGAETASLGHVRAAKGGTLLLDELTELAPDVQAMLLRALENREVIPLGESQAVPIDVRFVAAAQLPLSAAVEAGLLRADLRARLEGGVIALPALRDCREIVVEMFLALFERHAGTRPELGTAFAERLCLHDWPLNVRELDTVARRVAATNAGATRLDREAADAAFGSSGTAERRSLAPPSAAEERAPGPYSADEVAALLAALARHQGNVTKAAAELGLTRQKAYRMLQSAQKSRSGGG